MGSTERNRTSFWSRTPSLAKFLVLFESVVIVLLSSWMYEEYLNNPYLQSYVANVVQSQGALIAIATGFVAIFLVGGAVLLKSRSTMKLTTTLLPVHAATLAQTSSAPPPKSDAPSVSTTSPGLHPVVAALKAEISGSSFPIAVAPMVPAVVQAPQLEVKREALSSSPVDESRIAELEKPPPETGTTSTSPAPSAPAKAEAEKSNEQKSQQSSA